MPSETCMYARSCLCVCLHMFVSGPVSQGLRQAADRSQLFFNRLSDKMDHSIAVAPACVPEDQRNY